MADFYCEKTPHDLHLAANPVDFVERLQARGLVSLDALLGEYIQPRTPYPVLLGGSLPTGLGNPMSDVDLMVLLDDISSFRAPEPNERRLVLLREPSDPVRAIVIHAEAGLEIDVAIVDGALLLARLDAVLADGGALSREQRRLWGRLVSGWILQDGAGDALREIRLRRGGLELRAATSAFVEALKQFEDAQATASQDPDLSLHLARLAVEAAFLSYLAAAGVLDAGDKWVRLLARGALPTWSQDVAASAALAEEGLALLFPHRAASADLKPQLSAVAAFLRNVRREITADRRLAIAFQICPQVYEA